MTVEALRDIFGQCIEIMKMRFEMFGISISLWDFFLWAIVIVALLKLFFSLFE